MNNPEQTPHRPVRMTQNRRIHLGETANTNHKIKKPKKHRHSHNYQHLISGSETEPDTEGEDDEGGTRNPRIIQLEEQHSIHKLPKLNAIEHVFFQLVSSGNVSKAKEFLANNASSCNFIQVCNFEGYTVLHIAAHRQDEGMVDLLCREYENCIKPCILQDVLLHAVEEENVDIVMKLLEIMKIQKIYLERPLFSAGSMGPLAAMRTVADPIKIQTDIKLEINLETFPNSNFTNDITPFLLACQGQNYDLMDIFYVVRKRTMLSSPGLEDPHSFGCTCPLCKRFSDLENAIRRLNLYRGRCNPAYLCFINFKEGDFDPISEAFQLIQKLEQLVVTEMHFVSEYQDLISSLKQFTCRLLGQCRNSDEVNMLLSEGEGPGNNSDEHFDRLIWAIQAEQKEFVAHPHSQQVLFGIWTKGWKSWHMYTSKKEMVGWFLLWMIIFWIMAPISIFYQPKFWASPVSRFLSSLVSYVYFLAFLFVINWTQDNQVDRGPPNTFLEIPVIIWTAGHSVSIIIQTIRDGMSYLKSAWTWFDILTQSMFIAAFICWAIALDVDKKTKYKIPRPYWSAYEPILIGEGLLAMASIMSYARPICLLKLHIKMGPLISAMGEMWRDILDVLVFIGFIIGSFSVGFYYIYRNYLGWMDHDSTGAEVYQNEHFTTYSEVLNTLFFASMTESGADAPLILARNVIDPFDNSSTYNHHSFSENTGKLIYAVFHIVGPMMAMNLVTGLVISHYDRVQDDVDTEWKFMRGKIWMSFARGTVNPSPFNMIPTLPWIRSCCENKKSTRDPENPSKFSDRKLEYFSLIRKLVERYIRDKSEIAGVEIANTEIVTSLREDLAELREAIVKNEDVFDLLGKQEKWSKEIRKLVRKKPILPSPIVTTTDADEELNQLDHLELGESPIVNRQQQQQQQIPIKNSSSSSGGFDTDGTFQTDGKTNLHLTKDVSQSKFPSQSIKTSSEIPKVKPPVNPIVKSAETLKAKSPEAPKVNPIVKSAETLKAKSPEAPKVNPIVKSAETLKAKSPEAPKVNPIAKSAEALKAKSPEAPKVNPIAKSAEALKAKSPETPKVNPIAKSVETLKAKSPEIPKVNPPPPFVSKSNRPASDELKNKSQTQLKPLLVPRRPPTPSTSSMSLSSSAATPAPAIRSSPTQIRTQPQNQSGISPGPIPSPPVPIPGGISSKTDQSSKPSGGGGGQGPKK